jgi:hypothetical protein
MHTPRQIAPTFALTLLLAGPAAAQPGGTLTDATAMYSQPPGPSGQSLASPSGVQFRPDTGIGSQLYQNWWYYRVQGDTREYPFGDYLRSTGGSIASTQNTYLGNTATVKWTETSSTSVTRFLATYISNLTHTGTNAATLNQTFRIDNPGTAALNITLFNYADLDVNGQAVSDTDSATGGVAGTTITDGPFRMTHTITGSVPANAYQVAQFPALINQMVDAGAQNLNNSGLPFGPGDYTDAFQWDLSIPAGSFVTVGSLITVAPVPEPGTLFLAGAAAAGAVAWRRRDKR